MKIELVLIWKDKTVTNTVQNLVEDFILALDDLPVWRETTEHMDD